MNTTHQASIDALNDLIENARDGEFGFSQCVQRVQSASLRPILQRRADDCRNAAAELQVLVLRYGGKPADGGTALGALHRGWISVKDTLTPDSDRRLLDEVERGEDAALGRYRKALQADLTPEVREVITRQMRGVQANHDQIKSLRDTAPG
ncbi:MAG: PA2169 family four-helix-bundle protein [Burkholderiales bacterium]|jgi:uncharacterized protein (TIGR02284 family)|nr:PA2169 family four-helix-bundle protein [Burkholderiales bacterium]